MVPHPDLARGDTPSWPGQRGVPQSYPGGGYPIMTWPGGTPGISPSPGLEYPQKGPGTSDLEKDLELWYPAGNEQTENITFLILRMRTVIDLIKRVCCSSKQMISCSTQVQIRKSGCPREQDRAPRSWNRMDCSVTWKKNYTNYNCLCMTDFV